MNLEKLQMEVLQSGADDWVPLIEVTRLLQLSGVGPEAALVHHASDVIRGLVEAGLMRLGEVSDGGFFPFDEPLTDVVRRIELAVNSEPEEVWGWKYWLENTPKGDDVASGRG